MCTCQSVSGTSMLCFFRNNQNAASEAESFVFKPMPFLSRERKSLRKHKLCNSDIDSLFIVAHDVPWQSTLTQALLVYLSRDKLPYQAADRESFKEHILTLELNHFRMSSPTHPQGQRFRDRFNM